MAIIRSESAAIDLRVSGRKTRRVQAFVTAATKGLQSPICNLRTKVIEISNERQCLPATINDGGSERTCYICCPSAAYIDYGLDELRSFKSPALKECLAAVIRLLGQPLLTASGIDRQIQLNNWLLATNVIPPLLSGSLSHFTHMLCDAYPDRSLVWRSLNTYSDAGAIIEFRKCGFRLLPSRQVYLFDCRTNSPAIGRDERRDSVLLQDGAFEWVRPLGIRPQDFEGIALLYRKLYIEKYTSLNPQYEVDFLSELHRERIVEFHGLRGNNGMLEGVVGFFTSEDTLTAPIVGYNTALPASKGLYRRLMSIGQQLARERRLLFNMSAGAASFKLNRKAVPAIEYMAVYNRHLGFRRRAATAAVETVLKAVALPLIRRFEL